MIYPTYIIYKPVGIYSPIYQNLGALSNYKNLKQYANKDKLISDLTNHKIEGGILFN